MAKTTEQLLLENCIIIKGISKKTNREYQMLAIKRNSQFDDILIDMIVEGKKVDIIDLREVKPTEEGSKTPEPTKAEKTPA